MNRADGLISLEGFKEVLELLTGPELAVVALMMDGLSVAAAAELLGISHTAAGRRLARARRRILEKRPDLARRIEGKEAV